MTNFDEVWDKTKTAAQIAGKKTGEMVTLAKLKLKIAEAEHKISGLMEQIGRLTVEGAESGISRDAEIAELMKKVNTQKTKIAQLQSDIDEMRRQNRCAKCGAAGEESAVYCDRCGAKMP